MCVGAGAQLHYDCKYRGLLALSSREARLLGGNRTIAEPFEMNYGRVPSEYTRPIRYDTFTGAAGWRLYLWVTLRALAG
jgi:peptidylprolyl isomerase